MIATTAIRATAQGIKIDVTHPDGSIDTHDWYRELGEFQNHAAAVRASTGENWVTATGNRHGYTFNG